MDLVKSMRVDLVKHMQVDLVKYMQVDLVKHMQVDLVKHMQVDLVKYMQVEPRRCETRFSDIFFHGGCSKTNSFLNVYSSSRPFLTNSMC